MIERKKDLDLYEKLKEEKHDSFWHLLNHIHNVLGYEHFDALRHSLYFFKEEEIFERVLFIGLDIPDNHNNLMPPRPHSLAMGVMTHSYDHSYLNNINLHLWVTPYEHYKSLVEYSLGEQVINKGYIPDLSILELCDKFVIDKLSNNDFLKYFRVLSQKRRGIDIPDITMDLKSMKFNKDVSQVAALFNPPQWQADNNRNPYVIGFDPARI